MTLRELLPGIVGGMIGGAIAYVVSVLARKGFFRRRPPF